MNLSRHSICGCLMRESVGDSSRFLSYPGIGLVEWRLDALLHIGTRDVMDAAMTRLALPGRHPVIATNRPERFRGGFRGTEEDRMEVLGKAVRAGAEWIDLEDDLPGELLSPFRDSGARIVLSHHDFAHTPDLATLKRRVERLAATGAHVLKLATFAHKAEDNLRVLELIPFARQQFGAEMVAFCMGPLGRWSRLVCLLMGSPWTYVRFPELPPSAPGQFTVDEMQSLLEIAGAG